MVKKLIITSAIVAATTGIASADPTPYLGANVGITTNTSDSLKLTGVSLPAKLPSNFRGVPFTVFAGYGGIVNQNFYLAGEVFGTVATAEISNDYKLKTSYSYGASLLPGVMLSDHTLAFARVGVVRSRFADLNANANGAQVGFGLQTCVTQNVDLRAEYDFTAYKTVSKVSSPRQDAFNIGLVYKFD